MSDDRIQMPHSGGGIVRYFDEYKSKIEFSPKVVVGILILVIILEVLLHQFNWFGV